MADFDGSCRIADRGEFERVAEFCRSNGLSPRGSSQDLLGVKGREKDEEILRLIDMLKELGKHAVWSSSPPFPVDGSFFRIRRFRKTSKADLDKSDYVTAYQWGGDAMCMCDIGDGGIVHLAESFRPRVKIGWSPVFGVGFLVQGSVKERLEQENIVGLGFREVVFDAPLPRRLKVWELMSSIRVGGCLLKAYESECSQRSYRYMAWQYDDSGITPGELAFKESVKAGLDGADFIAVEHNVSGGRWAPRDGFLFGSPSDLLE